MLIEVGDPGRNLALNLCFVAIVALTAMSVVPWRGLGLKGIARFARWLPIPVFALAWLYEVLMPNRFDIRVDLLLLLPMYLVVLIAAVVRWRGGRGTGTREGH